MDKRLTIGLIYSFNENWIGGTYYIENLISALEALPEAEQPLLKIYCYKDTEYNALVDRIKCRNTRAVFIKNIDGVIDRLINKLTTTLFDTYLITGTPDSKVDLIFPNPSSYHFSKIKTQLFWVADFQEKHYPDFFSRHQIQVRKQEYDSLVDKKLPIVFSSENAKNDFLDLYPDVNNKLFVMPFAVTLMDYRGIQQENLKIKYDLPELYFICSNQFWAHKNHKIVLQALKYLRDDGIYVTVVFTGKPFDDRNPDYYEMLMGFVKDNKLEDQVKFLGFIPRDEQLVLMNGSQAIIQPSLFEGWSTVVEDAKALNKNIIVSDIPVHREQLPGYDFFFSPEDYQTLGQHIKKLSGLRQQFLNVDYNENIIRFGRNFMHIAYSLVK